MPHRSSSDRMVYTTSTHCYFIVLIFAIHQQCVCLSQYEYTHCNTTTQQVLLASDDGYDISLEAENVTTLFSWLILIPKPPLRFQTESVAQSTQQT